MSLCSSKLISVFVLLMTTFDLKNNVLAKKGIIQDLPIKSDFDHYLKALEKLIDYCTRNKHFVDVNMKYGLFLIDVNLKNLLLQKPKRIPSKMHSRLEKLFEKNDILSDYYRSTVMKNETERNTKLQLLFYNATTWREPPDTFNLDLLNQTEIYDAITLENIYGNFQQYYDKVFDLENFEDLSDDCLSELAQTEDLYSNDESQVGCMTNPHCRQMIQGGQDFGYVLTHRLFYLTFARFHRKCNVLSEREDKNMIEQFCLKCFYEAEYIVLNEFKMDLNEFKMDLIDLLFEFILGCGVFGHAQFLRNDWLKRVLVFQTKDGCFSSEVKIGERTRSSQDKDKESKIERQLTIIHGDCNGHFMAVAAGALSTFLRYVIELYS